MRSAPKKELKTDEEPVACDVCGRTILKGERTEPYLAPGGRRKTVCELCIPRADHEGWIRESAHADLPATPRRPPRRSFVGRVREALAGNGAAETTETDAEPAPDEGSQQAPSPRERQEPAPPPRRRESRHIRAVPTTKEVKIGRRGRERRREADRRDEKRDASQVEDDDDLPRRTIRDRRNRRAPGSFPPLRGD